MMNKYFLSMILCLISLRVLSNEFVPIEDELLSKAKLPQVNQISHVQKEPIIDELVEPTKHGDVFKLHAYQDKKIEFDEIKDELLTEDFIKNTLDKEVSVLDKVDHDFLERKIDLSKHRKIKTKTVYDFTKTQIPIPVKVSDNYNFKQGIHEGEHIPFVSVEEFVINGKTFEVGTTILGRVETISASDKMGVPQSVKIDNFYIEHEKGDIDLNGHISKDGANRAIWVYPLYQAGNLSFYVAGFIFVPIHGGVVKLTPKETFTLFYETP